MIVEECPWCSRYKIWSHIIQYKTIFELKVDYIVELKDKLINVKHGEIKEEEINEMIKDIRKFLVNRDEFKMN